MRLGICGVVKIKDKNLISKRGDINNFLQKIATTPLRKKTDSKGRLIFALDATASREASWDQASHIQGEMFQQTVGLGGLSIQLCYFRGFGEFYASAWMSDANTLLKNMLSVYCLGGHTQIAKLLKHSISEAKSRKINALVFVGDCIEEDVDKLCHLAGELGLLGVPVFVFHEGNDMFAEKAFRQIARITQGAYSAFDLNSAQQLKDLLAAVAVYAAGGKSALIDYSKKSGNIVKLLNQQLK